MNKEVMINEITRIEAATYRNVGCNFLGYYTKEPILYRKSLQSIYKTLSDKNIKALYDLKVINFRLLQKQKLTKHLEIMKARTLKQVNKEIQKKIGNIVLQKGKGYFYVSSDDNKIGLKLSSLYSTSIYVCHLNQQSMEDWVKDVREIAIKVL